MPDINMQVFEEAKRNQLITEIDIQTQVALDDYQVQLSNIANPTQSQDNVIIDRFGEFLPHWNESLDFDTWVKMSMEIAGKRLLVLSGNSNVGGISNGDDVFESFDDFTDELEKYSGNPIITDSNGAGDEDSNQLYQGRVIDYNNTLHRIYYTANQDSVNKDQIFTATSPKTNNLETNWTKYTESGDVVPILSCGAGGAWDDANCYLGNVIKESSTSYKMWYIGDDGSGAPHKMRVGYATSTDGINWTKYGSNPIYEDFSVDAGGIAGICVIKESDTKYYAVVFHYANYTRTDLLESSDGISWSSIDTNIVPGIAAFDFQKFDDIYYIYGSIPSGVQSKCFTCTTPDGTYVSRGTQIAAIGSGWEQRANYPSIFKLSDTTWALLYSGWDGSIKPQIGLATIKNDVPYGDWDIQAGDWSCSDGVMKAPAGAAYDKQLKRRSELSLPNNYITEMRCKSNSGSTIAPTFVMKSDSTIVYNIGHMLRYFTATHNLNPYLIVDGYEEEGSSNYLSQDHYYISQLITKASTIEANILDGNRDVLAGYTTIPATYTWTGNAEDFFGLISGDAGIIDWIIIRKYVTTEPTLVVSTEQNIAIALKSFGRTG